MTDRLKQLTELELQIGQQLHDVMGVLTELDVATRQQAIGRNLDELKRSSQVFHRFFRIVLRLKYLLKYLSRMLAVARAGTHSLPPAEARQVREQLIVHDAVEQEYTCLLIRLVFTSLTPREYLILSHTLFCSDCHSQFDQPTTTSVRSIADQFRKT